MLCYSYWYLKVAWVLIVSTQIRGESSLEGGMLYIHVCFESTMHAVSAITEIA